MAWTVQNGAKGWYDEKTQTFVPKDKLVEYRKVDPNAYAEAGSNEELAIINPPDERYKHGQTRYEGETGQTQKWNQNAGEWVNIQTPDPNEQMVGNLEFLKPDNALNNPIPQFIPISKESIAEQERLRKNAINPAGMDEINRAAGAQGDLISNYRQYMDPASMKRYEDALYEQVANRMRNEAGRVNEQTQADLAARGLGMSTVVNDITGATNRNLMQNLGDAATNATVNAEQMRQKYLQDMGTTGAQMTNTGVQKQNLFNAAATPYQNAIQYQDANKILNLGLQNQAWENKKNDLKYLQNLPQAVTTGQNQIGATAANVGNNVFNAANATAAGQNTVAGQVGSVIGNAFANKQTGFIPLAQVQGGASGVAQGATTTTPKQYGGFVV